MKKIKILLTSLFMTVTWFLTPVSSVSTGIEEVAMFEQDEEYYSDVCYRNSINLNQEEKRICAKYYIYMMHKNDQLKSELKSLENSKAEIEDNIEAYLHKIREYDAIIDTYEMQIEDINDSVADMEDEIASLNLLIDRQTEEVHQKSEKIRAKMVKMQGFIGANYSLNFIFSANSIEDLIKRYNDIKYFNEYEVVELKNLNSKKNELIKTKNELENVYNTIDDQRKSLQESQSLVQAMRSQSSSILFAFKNQQAELIAKEMRQMVDLEQVTETLERVKDHINMIPTSNEWLSPIENRSDYWISAGVWNYPESFGGGLHLGLDMAAEKGTVLRAPANGIVLFSSNACSADGELGDKCGKPGVAYGGNQVTLLVSHLHRTYAISFFHMMADSPIEAGVIVKAGDPVGKVGMTGNVTGPHTHIEMHDLGYISMNDFIKTWDGDLSFGNEWGNAALKHICDDTNETALSCRTNPYVLVEGQIEDH